MLKEIFFLVHESPEGGYEAEALNHSIYTEADTLDKVSLADLQSAAALVARIVARIANDETFPGRQRSIDEVRELFAAAGILGQVEHAGRFPPATKRSVREH